MSPWRFILDSLRHHRLIHLAVAMGVCVATAVLTGALLVGDSVRGSLRDLTIQRLGRIDQALITPQPFRAELSAELSDTKGFDRYFESAHPALLLSGTLEAGSGDDRTRATQVALVGHGPEFHGLGVDFPQVDSQDAGLMLTESLADELQVVAGDEVVVRVPTFDAVPSDSPLGEKASAGRSRRLKVDRVLPAQGLARFSLRPSQHLPRNAFLPLPELQDLVEQDGQVNAILVASGEPSRATGEAAARLVNENLQPRLADYGLQLVRREPEGRVAYVEIGSQSLVLRDSVVAAARQAFPGIDLQPVVTYLANTIRISERVIPYSTITGIDSTAELGPVLDKNGEPIVLADDEIVLNRWAADDLEAEVGDEVTLTYYEPESTHGNLRERGPASFQLRSIVDLANADGQPTPASDPHLTPQLEGVTDKRSINEWELPFELVEPIRRADEDYWEEYSTTPKAFVSLATAKKRWQSRWGTISLLRAPASGAMDVDQMRAKLAATIDPQAMGFTFLPVKQQGLAASSATTPFDGLFLGFSFFLIASALMLIVLLFQLGVEQRAGEIGVLAATGLARPSIARLLSREALLVAALGAVAGAAGGVAYAWLMVTGLNTVWQEAIATPFLQLHVTARSLLLGWGLSVVATWLAIRLSLRSLVRLPVRKMLAGQTTSDTTGTTARPRMRWVEMLLIAVAAALVLAGTRSQGEAQAGMFFGCGAAVLAALLIHARLAFSRWATIRPTTSRLTLAGLAFGNATRHPGRSTLTVGLVAAACFLIVAISAFHIDTSASGTGGFAIFATSDQPIHYDLNSPDGRWDLGLSDKTSEQLADWHFEALRVYQGDEASCLSLYRPSQPRVLGLPDWRADDAPFAWAATRAASDGDPWQQLQAELGADNNGRKIVPVVLDANTAMYSLQIYGGVGAQLTIRDGFDQPVTLQIVGLLKNSMLQGDLLISQQNFVRLFPQTGGYGAFLARPTTGADIAADVDTMSKLLESSALGDYGFDATSARQRLAGFLAVQNTYLSTFQSLGALGLLLGTFGLAVVQLRSVLQRRGELALMRAEGFARRRLIRLVLLENGALLGGGLAIGCLAAAVALIPHWAPQNVSVPWATLAGLLATIAVVGTVAAWLSTRRALSVSIVPALRGD